MLIRWATELERNTFHIDSSIYGCYDVIVATDRISNLCLGYVVFSRKLETAQDVVIMDDTRKDTIKEKLLKCANNQIHRKGGSFHYNYPAYAREAEKSNCPICSALALPKEERPMPENEDLITELRYSLVTSSIVAQGKLFGKCTVTSRFHSEHFYDMPTDRMIEYMSDVQKTAKLLHKHTQAVKINYEIHMNSGPHLHCHLFPRYLDDDFPSAPIDYRITDPSPYESQEEYEWFITNMRKDLQI